MQILKWAGCALVMTAAGLSHSQAQDYSEAPAFGSTRLVAGFLPDPHVVNLTAGGSISARSRFSECRGYIANAPDYSVYYEAGFGPLIFSVDADRDTTLVINGPDTSWYCDDDGAEAPLNPLVRFENPQSGRYDVWVGTYSEGSGTPATLFVSEIGEFTRESAGAAGSVIFENNIGLDIGAPAIAGDVTLEGGFLPDPWQVNVMAGGRVDIDDMIGDRATGTCRGTTTRAPTLQLNYDGVSSLYIYTSGNPDTTLAINGPNGQWYCSDDAVGTDAGLSFNGQSGIYDIYVGIYSGSPQQTTLRVSEIAMGHAPYGK